MLTSDELDEIVAELASRPGHEKVRVLLYRLLVDGLDADSRDIDFERPAPEVRGRMDALLGRTVFELKSDLQRERTDAENGLARYLSERENETGERYVGIATDGAEFIAFFLRDDQVLEVGLHRTEPDEPRTLLAWLQGTVAIGEELIPDPHTITREFGRQSLAAQRAMLSLNELWTTVAGSPEARLKRELWNRLLRLAYGADVGDDTLFLQHTYLVVVAKAVAWSAMIDAPPPNGAALLHGTAFSDLGIEGQSEADFFDWVLEAEGGTDLVMRIARQVNRFRLRDIRVDILKALYESLIDPETRHDLGEYYTPDWLAARMVSAAVDRPLEQRVMDPACGSGTFLFHAVRAVLSAAEATGVHPEEAVRRATQQIAGIDIHPVAVIFARATYLLALMPALPEGHPGSLTVPVYLGDALQWNLARPGEHETEPDMFADTDMLEVFVPEVTVSDPEPRRLPAATLNFPEAVASDTGLFDRVVNTMIEFGARERPVADFGAWLDRLSAVTPGDRDVLKDTYELMARLQNEGRNHIWGYVARNLARPVWLSSEGQKADVVVGNPPWLAYRHMRGEYQERYWAEARAAKVWWSGRGTSANDLSAYFFLRAALLYMRDNGRIALIMPHAAMSRRAYANFRRGEVVRSGNFECWLRFTDAWGFGPEVWPLFPVPCCVLFANRHDKATAASLPSQIQRFEGTLPRRDAVEAEAAANLTRAAAPWPAEAADEGESPYRRAFRQGAILVPRRLVLVEPVQTTGLLPANPAFPLVRGRVGNQDKRPWKTVEPPQGAIEAAFLRLVLLGESVAPFRVIASLRAVIPWSEERDELMDSKTALRRGYPRLAQWLEQAEALWNEKGRGRRTFLEQYDFFGQLSCQFPIAPARVVYTKAGTNLAAAMVRDETAVIDHKLYWGRVTSVNEAYYLCGLLNSEALRTEIEQFQSQGQWGARDFDKYVFNAPIPRFSDEDALHRELAEAAETAETVANEVPLREGEYFTRTRRRIRDALTHHGIAARLEELATELLDIA